MKLYNQDCITLDGRLDEPIWNEVKEYSGFKGFQGSGGKPAPVEGYFRIIPCEDRIYIGVKFEEPDIVQVVAHHHGRPIWCTDSVELFLAPSGDSFDYYHFVVTLGGQMVCDFYSECGNIKPDPFAPQWRSATYVGEDYWSAEIELPLTAFYMTPTAAWQSEWLINVCRGRADYSAGGATRYYTWADLFKWYQEPNNFRKLDGFPIRPAENDVKIVSAAVNITDKSEKGCTGTLTVSANVPVDGVYAFVSDRAEGIEVSLIKGANEFTVPCCFPEEGRQKVALELIRKTDGVCFKRWYPVRIVYEPIKLELTLPEFRGNFYPGQDYSKVVGRVVANKPVTVTLEGPGIGTKTAMFDGDGNFTIDTADFEIGEAMLTITDSENTLTKKIRRLAPTGRMMTWISGGNLIVNGKPTLRRNMYAEYYMGGEAFKLKYDADDLHQTLKLVAQTPMMAPGRLIKGSESPAGEATKDVVPCAEMFQKIDAIIEGNRERDFAYYYLDDEPECRQVSTVYLKHLYDYITEKDPYHVVLMASRGAGDYILCCDWVEAHAYINPIIKDGKRMYDRPINTLGGYLETVLKQNRPDKCVGFMPTCFSSSSSYCDYPTFDEMICHCWAAMLPGGKTLWSYAYHDLNDRASLYEGTRYVNASFEVLEDMVLLAKRTELLKTQEVHGVLYELNGEKMFVLVNFTQEPQSVTLEGISGQWYNFRHGGMLSGNHFALKPLEVVIGTSKVRDAGLPTYQETAALVDKLEYERTHSGSLLFARHRDIGITATVATNGYKLFDGTRDNLGWTCVAKEGKFFEMDLTKIKPTISKLVVYGFQIDDMALKVRVGGELSVPVIKETKNEQFSKTFLFDEPICPDALRLEFGERRVELYEIEAF